MKALEFKAKIRNNRIRIPPRMQSELKPDQDREVRVIVFIDEPDTIDDMMVREATTEHFFEGYAESDSIYDNM